MDPLGIAVGAIVFAIGWGVGRAQTAIAHARALPKAKDPMRCLCTHMKAFHDAEHGCHAHMPNDWANGRTCRCVAFESEDPDLYGILGEG